VPAVQVAQRGGAAALDVRRREIALLGAADAGLAGERAGLA